MTFADMLLALCRAQLAGYKRPKEIRFVPFDRFPRSTTGKVQRGEVERWLGWAEPAPRTGHRAR
jgi:acyl-CoA synthetase (AMP-forming)/AMP-acid ligase II